MIQILTSLSNGVRGEEDKEEPPTGNLFVDLHLLVVLVINIEGSLVPWVERKDEWLEVIPVVQQDVGDGSTERQVGGNQIEGVGGGEVSRAELCVSLGVEPAILEEGGLVVLRTIGSLRKVSDIVQSK